MELTYDFRAARQRIMDLTDHYRRLKHTQQPVGNWDRILWMEIEAIETEIAEAKRKMTAGQGDHFEVKLNIQLTPVYMSEQVCARSEA
ncbi:hypothetical protein [Paenibacillus spongiae]|uniref:Uncharacterized protein n=1 Tax=Paenibacillus spongiae TaxID=2909671 RepID=A0ABY5S624_9BACL|nr:hypothetical protein [Paenibacillus spongiae]UVI28188.1 hypothetical protein L1F29_22390 [Paenibacillus spongiae]